MNIFQVLSLSIPSCLINRRDAGTARTFDSGLTTQFVGSDGVVQSFTFSRAALVRLVGVKESALPLAAKEVLCGVSQPDCRLGEKSKLRAAFGIPPGDTLNSVVSLSSLILRGEPVVTLSLVGDNTVESLRGDRGMRTVCLIGEWETNFLCFLEGEQSLLLPEAFSSEIRNLVINWSILHTIVSTLQLILI